MAAPLHIVAQRGASPAGTRPGEAGQLAPARLESLLASDLRRVACLLRDSLESRAGMIPDLAGYLLDCGGKRLRPSLTLAAARLCGGKPCCELAAAVELIHTATLLHDDVVDASSVRRGQLTANLKWGNKASILVGDFLFSRAFQLVIGDGRRDVMRRLAQASALIAEGEVLQLTTARQMDISQPCCLRIMEAKTARLFAVACRIGALAADAGGGQDLALERFGLNLGMAFQATDDLLDYFASDDSHGKTRGDDFRDGKVTLPALIAHRLGSEDNRRFWRRCFEHGVQRDGDFEHARALIISSGAADQTTALARLYAAKARQALGGFDDTALKRALLETVSYCAERAA